jgi:hypothetical protein
LRDVVREIGVRQLTAREVEEVATLPVDRLIEGLGATGGVMT